jgi:peptidoglycan/xylan/chitin deacetylase (PgdA/CDA1 family)
MLAFELDGPTSWTAKDPRVWDWPKTFSLGAYGPWRGLPRVLELLDELELPATFFVPGWVAEQWPDGFREIGDRGHELAHHGYLHEPYTGEAWDEHREEIERSQEIFERLGGARAVGFRPPSGDPHPDHRRLLRELGFSYTSALCADDRPYRLPIDGTPSDLIEIPLHWELDDMPQFAFNFFPAVPIGQDRVASPATTLDIWRREFEGYHRYGLCYVLTLHPELIGKPGRVRMLETLLREMKAKSDVWFARGDAIADWWRQAHPVEQERRAA